MGKKKKPANTSANTSVNTSVNTSANSEDTFLISHLDMTFQSFHPSLVIPLVVTRKVILEQFKQNCACFMSMQDFLNLEQQDGASNVNINSLDYSVLETYPKGSRLFQYSIPMVVGERVIIQGLTSESGQRLNGKEGVVISYIAEKGRCAVQIEGEETHKSIKRFNLKPIEQPKQGDSVADKMANMSMG